ncbi:MAG: histidinol-phosphate transaminase [Cyanothece sp. SIO1E1]|nr:histidinol-phosphate transaminase [Cyanothece sp. SIO1E1]
MLSFIRSDLARLTAYKPHPGGDSGAAEASVSAAAMPMDRLDTNESPLDLPESLKQKLAWAYEHEIEANRYPDGGHADLKQAIATYVNESVGLDVGAIAPANISVGNGSDELIRSLLIATCLGGEGSILVAHPTFSMYSILAQTLGIPVITIGRAEANFEIDLTAAQAAIEQTQQPPIRAVFMVHPNSPTGNVLTEAEITWLKGLPEQVLVVVDEAYFEFSQQSVVATVLQRPNWVILRTFSKAFRLAAHRVGYAIAHPELTATLEKVRLPYNLPGFSQAVAKIALAHRHLLLDSIPTILAERTRLAACLNQQSKLQIWPSATNFLYTRLKVTALTDAFQLQTQATALQTLFQQLKTQGTLIRHTGGGLRITIGTPDENQRTLERIQTVCRSL